MRPFRRLGMAVLVVFLTRATLSAVTTQECMSDCSALQAESENGLVSAASENEPSVNTGTVSVVAFGRAFRGYVS